MPGCVNTLRYAARAASNGYHDEWEMYCCEMNENRAGGLVPSSSYIVPSAILILVPDAYTM